MYYCLPYLDYLGIMSQIPNLLHLIKGMEEPHIELLDGWGLRGELYFLFVRVCFFFVDSSRQSK